MHHRVVVQVVFLVCLCAVLFVARLGERGLAYTEGHRVGPAWEMLDAGTPWDARETWLVPHLFEAAYLRKPPGMMWAIAGSSSALGRTEFAARLPSALAMTVLTLVAWRVSRRWFGAPWGLAAGVAQALFPFFWSSARSAEIEALHAAATGAASLLLLDAMLRADARRWLSALGAGLGVTVMVLTKGPAGLPVLAAIPLGACLAVRSIAPLARPSLVLVLLVPGFVLGAVAWGVFDALDRLDGPIITQGVGEFLWDRSKLGRIFTLPIVAFGNMCPAALGLLLVPWHTRPDESRADTARPPDNTAAHVARALGIAWLLAVVCYTLLGVSNPRYTLPAATLLAPVAAWALARAWGGAGPSLPLRGRRLARLLSLGAPWGWAVILSAGFVGFLAWYETPRGKTSGDIPGAALAGMLAPEAERGVTIWADELVECRPEVLLYARLWEPGLRVRWIKPLESLAPAVPGALHAPLDHVPRPEPGDIVIVRTDRHGLDEGAPTEAQRCAALLTGAALVHRFNVHKFAFDVWRLGGTPGPAGSEPDSPGSPLPQP